MDNRIHQLMNISLFSKILIECSNAVAINQGMKEYGDFFDALLTCAYEKDKIASQNCIHNLLAELKIDKHAQHNSKVIQRLGSSSVEDIIEPYKEKIKNYQKQKHNPSLLILMD